MDNMEAHTFALVEYFHPQEFKTPAHDGVRSHSPLLCVFTNKRKIARFVGEPTRMANTQHHQKQVVGRNENSTQRSLWLLSDFFGYNLRGLCVKKLLKDQTF